MFSVLTKEFFYFIKSFSVLTKGKNPVSKAVFNILIKKNNQKIAEKSVPIISELNINAFFCVIAGADAEFIVDKILAAKPDAETGGFFLAIFEECAVGRLVERLCEYGVGLAEISGSDINAEFVDIIVISGVNGDGCAGITGFVEAFGEGNFA